MSRKAVRRSPPAKEVAPIHRLELQEFARKLYQALQARGWTQSDLARAAFGTTKDPRGYTVAKGRDRISVYLRGQSVPDPRNLEKIARALGTTPEELAPDLHADTINREHPELAIRQAAGQDRVHLIVNQIVPLSVASKVVAILSSVHAAAE